jgi:hypothetical protein
MSRWLAARCRTTATLIAANSVRSRNGPPRQAMVDSGNYQENLPYRLMLSGRRTAVIVAAFIVLLGNAAVFAKNSGSSGGHSHGNISASSSGTTSTATHNRTSSNNSGSGRGSSYRGAHYRHPPAMDSKRSVVEQDCSKPIAQTGGNLRCK